MVAYDLLIKNARLRRGAAGLVDIGIVGDKVSAIAAGLTAPAAAEVDAQGSLVKIGRASCRERV